MKRFTIAFIVIFSTIFSSCDIFGRDQVAADGYRNITLKNNKFSIEYWLGSSPGATDKDSYHLYIKADSLVHFKRALADMFETTYNPENVQAITFYTDTIFKEETVNLNSPSISGVQVHYLEDSFLKTKVYFHKNDLLQEVDELNSFVDYFSPNDVHDTSEIFKSAKNSVFIMVNTEMTTKYETGKSDYNKHLADYKLQNK
ncbi:MAG: hypothetical protein AB8B65_19470 [Kordia sp.]|uniref:hypothetical protein n=1 Tax=Kordia sp. TaxID=1965332 RepID=UPI003859BFBB